MRRGVAAILALLLLLPGCALAPPAARLAFVGTEGDLFTVRADGSGLRRLTRRGGAEDASTRSVHFWPAWSPDGRHIAAGRTDIEDDALVGARLHAVPAGGGATRLLYAHEESIPIYWYWAPDSRSVALLTTFGGTVGLHVSDGDAVQGLGTAYPFYFTWAPDSRSLSAHVGGDGSRGGSVGLYHVPADGTPGRELPLGLGPSAFRAPARSADGRTLYAAGVGANGREVVVAIAEDAPEPRRLVELEGPAAFVLSPTGDRLAVARYYPGTLRMDHLDVVDLATGTRTQWDAGSIVAFYWSPDGRRLAWLRADPAERGMSWHAAEDPRAIRTIVGGFVPSNALDATLGFFDQYAQSHTVWSPDSSRIAFAGHLAADPSMDSRVYVADASAQTKPRAIADGLFATWSPR